MRESPTSRTLCLLGTILRTQVGMPQPTHFTTWLNASLRPIPKPEQAIQPAIDPPQLIDDHELYPHSLKQLKESKQDKTQQTTTVAINHLFDATDPSSPKMVGHSCWQTLAYADTPRALGLPAGLDSYLDFLQPRPIGLLHTFSIYPEFQGQGYFPCLWALAMQTLQYANIRQVGIAPTSESLHKLYKRKLATAGFTQSGLFMTIGDPDAFTLDPPRLLLARTPART